MLADEPYEDFELYPILNRIREQGINKGSMVAIQYIGAGGSGTKPTGTLTDIVGYITESIRSSDASYILGVFVTKPRPDLWGHDPRHELTIFLDSIVSINRLIESLPPGT